MQQIGTSSYRKYATLVAKACVCGAQKRAWRLGQALGFDVARIRTQLRPASRTTSTVFPRLSSSPKCEALAVMQISGSREQVMLVFKYRVGHLKHVRLHLPRSNATPDPFDETPNDVSTEAGQPEPPRHPKRNRSIVLATPLWNFRCLFWSID